MVRLLIWGGRRVSGSGRSWPATTRIGRRRRIAPTSGGRAGAGAGSWPPTAATFAVSSGVINGTPAHRSASSSAHSGAIPYSRSASAGGSVLLISHANPKREKPAINNASAQNNSSSLLDWFRAKSHFACHVSQCVLLLGLGAEPDEPITLAVAVLVQYNLGATNGLIALRKELI